MNNKSKNFGIGGYKGRIIFLGDGTEVLTDSDDAEMFDNSEEDKDLATQVSKNSVDGDDVNGLPPRAPSPPPRGTKKQAEASKTETDELTKNETVDSDAAKEGTGSDAKAADSSTASK